MTDLLDAALAAQLGRPLYDAINKHLAEGQRAEAEVRRLSLMVDEYGTGAGLLADKVQRVREALASFDGRGVITPGGGSLDIPTAGEVLDKVRAALDEPDGARSVRWLHILFTSPDPTTANTSALAIADHLAAEFPGVGMRITTNATEAGPSCSPAAEETEPNNPAATEATEPPTLRERHRAEWLTLTDAERAARIAELDEDDEPEQPERTTPDNPVASSDLAEQLHAAIASEMYEYRERTMWWPEGAITGEIARLATRGALEALGLTEPTPPAPRDPCPHCEASSERIPRAELGQHIAEQHPDVKAAPGKEQP